MEEKFYHTYYKSGDEYRLAHLFCIKGEEIHIVSPENPQKDLDDIQLHIYIDDEIVSIIDDSFSDEENIKKAIQKLYPTHDVSSLLICKSELNQGEFYPNIYRPIVSRQLTKSPLAETDLNVFLPFYDQAEYQSHLSNLSYIYKDLSDLFTYIEPDEANKITYGFKIQQNIISSCTVIDSMFQNLMRKHGCEPINANFTITDYLKTKDPLRLNQYKISFARYLNITPLSPFSKWNKGEKLSWYQDYHKIKHDWINNKKKASLINAIKAFSGAIILFLAQYGDNDPIWKKEFGDKIKIKERPHFKFNEFYLPLDLFETKQWTEKYYQF